MALTKTSFSMIQGAMLNVLDFGAVGDGVAHDNVPINAAIEYAFANGIGTIYFPNGDYYFAAPVTVLMDAEQAIAFLGDAPVGYGVGGTSGGTKITGAAGIESLFIFSKTNLLLAGGYAFTCSSIRWISADFGTNGPLTALKSKIGGAPMRPFIVKNCTFKNFDKAIVSDISETGGLTTGLCQVIIRENTFVFCNRSLYGTGGLGCILDLDFSDNVSENGGAIEIIGLGGTFRIADNLLEGQVDNCQLTGGLMHGEYSRNYHEINLGNLLKVSATNPNSSITVQDNYILNCSGAQVNM